MTGPNLVLSNAAGAIDGFLFIIMFLVGMYMTWRALGSLKWDTFMFDPFGTNIRTLRFLLSLVGGFLLGLMAAVYMFAVQLVKVMF